MPFTRKLFFTGLVLGLMSGCSQKSDSPPAAADSLARAGTFGHAVRFLKSYRSVIVLGTAHSATRVLISPKDQARVMTSSSAGDDGKSYGWINYDLYKSRTVPGHINALGGEDRFWMGPEGGQYALFFKQGSPFDFENWQTPAVMDTEPFDVVSADSLQATFQKSASVVNYHGFRFDLRIARKIMLYDRQDILREFGIDIGNAVAFESRNSITNTGAEKWTKSNGLISIWILGMLSPSDHTTIIVPHKKPGAGAAGITDNYFGKIPAGRISKGDSLVMMKGDGRYRGKIGIPPSLAKNVAGSYDADRHILTLIKFDLDRNADYVKSTWEQQADPYLGDAVNAYNDGPLTSGGQLGPFYELESSSPARELVPGDSITHRHITLHVEGDEATLDAIAMKTLGIGLHGIRDAIR